MRSLISAMARRSLLDALLVALALQDVALDDARRDDVTGSEIARLDEVLDLGDGHLRGGRHDRVEIPRSSAIDEIPHAVAAERFHEGEVGVQRPLEDVVLAVDRARFLP